MVEALDEPVRQSFLMWLFAALGLKYTLLLPLVAFITFAVVLVLIVRGRGAAMVGAILIVVPLPVYVGVFGTVDGLIASLQVISTAITAVQANALATAGAMSLVSTWVGMVLTVPSLILAGVGLIIRSLQGEQKNSGKGGTA